MRCARATRTARATRSATGSRRHPDQASRIVVRINDAASPWFAADLAFLSQAGVAIRHAAQGRVRGAGCRRRVGACPRRPRAAADRDRARRAGRRRHRRRERRAAPRLRHARLRRRPRPLRRRARPDLPRLAHRGRVALRRHRGAHRRRHRGASTTKQQLLADLAFARALGFGAKLCIHPRQVAAIHEALLPTAGEIAWARRVLAAAAGAPARCRSTAGWSTGR